MLKNILLNRINRMGKSHVSSLILCNYIKKEAEIRLLKQKSARRGSNPRPPPWQGGAPPLSHSRIINVL